MALLRLVTWNLRFDSKPDNITVEQSLRNLPGPLIKPVLSNNSTEKPWSTRRIKAAEVILQSGVVIADFQEALVRQVNDLVQLLGPGWNFVGVGRDDGVTAGEFSPIFYDKTAIKILSWDTFWLSNTPFVPSRFPGAGSTRLCTAAFIQYTPPSLISRPLKFTLLNTHLDDQSDDQRKLGASLILTRAKFEAVNTGGPVIVTGDFNSPSIGSDSGAYDIITGSAPPVPIPADFAAKFNISSSPDPLPNFHTLDSRSQTPILRIAGNFATFTGFSSNGQIQSGMDRIDFVFGDSASAGSLWSSSDYFAPSVLSDDGVLASDHRPVFVSLNLGGTPTQATIGDVPQSCIIS